MHERNRAAIARDGPNHRIHDGGADDRQKSLQQNWLWSRESQFNEKLGAVHFCLSENDEVFLS